MAVDTNVLLLAAGGISFLIGLFLRRWAGRRDLVGSLTDSAWQVVRGKRRGGRKTDIEEKFAAIASAATTAGRARRATGSVIGHLLSATVGLIGLALILAGLILIAGGVYMTLRP